MSVHLLQNKMGSQIISTEEIVLPANTPDISQTMAIGQNSHFKHKLLNVLTQACLQHAYNHVDAQGMASFQALKVLVKLDEFLLLQDQHSYQLSSANTVQAKHYLPWWCLDARASSFNICISMVLSHCMTYLAYLAS